MRIRNQVSWDPDCWSWSCPGLATDTPRTQILIVFSVGPGCSTSQEPRQPSSAFLHHHTALHHPNKSKIAPWGWRKTGKLLWTDPYFLVIRGVLTQIKEKGSLFFFSKANKVSKWREAVFLSRVGSISGKCPLIRNATINPHFPINQCYSVPTVFGFCEAEFFPLVKTEARCRKQIF